MDLKKELSKVVDGDINDDDNTLKFFSHDASIFEVMPKVIVAPKNVSDIERVVKFVNDNPDQKLSITARSGGTDMTGGPLNQSIILNMLKYFNKIIEIGEETGTTQPGVYYRDFEAATLKKDLLMPSYPASREICTVGGIVNNNSGGEKTLTYGKSERYVKEIKVVLSDGKEYTIKSLTKAELDKKMALKTFEGQFYSKVYQLVTKNKDLLAAAKPKVSKNSAGYYLWNVWDGETFDLPKLFVGSQGTFGITTQATFRLIHPKKYSKMLVIFLKDFKKLAQITQQVLEYKPESFESYDDNTLKLALRFFPEVVRFFKLKNILWLGKEFMPEMWMSLTGGMPKLVLMAEFTGDSQEEVDKQATLAQQSLAKFRVQNRLTKNPDDARKYWVIRRESFNLLRHHIRNKHTAPFIDDLCVRPDQLPEFLPRLDKILKKYPQLIYTIAGHVGDGNFHIIPLMDFHNPKAPEIIKEVCDKVFDLVFEFKGTITAEHNDGIIRSPYLEKMYGEKVYKLFEEVKNIFDPNHIFNPGKKVGASLTYTLSHIEKE